MSQEYVALKPRRRTVFVTFIIALIAAIAVAAIAILSFQNANNARVEDAAKQRDEQVIQLAKRIEANSTGKTGGGELAIVSALVDLSYTDDRFWVLTGDDLLLFAKDIQETNQHRGLPVSNYIDSQEYHQALSTASSGKTTRARIALQGKTFDANVTSITFNGITYELTLLTKASEESAGPAFGVPQPALIAICAMFVLIVAIPTIISAIIVRSRRRSALMPVASTSDAASSDAVSAPAEARGGQTAGEGQREMAPAVETPSTGAELAGAAAAGAAAAMAEPAGAEPAGAAAAMAEPAGAELAGAAVAGAAVAAGAALVGSNLAGVASTVAEPEGATPAMLEPTVAEPAGAAPVAAEPTTTEPTTAEPTEPTKSTEQASAESTAAELAGAAPAETDAAPDYVTTTETGDAFELKTSLDVPEQEVSTTQTETPDAPELETPIASEPETPSASELETPSAPELETLAASELEEPVEFAEEAGAQFDEQHVLDLDELHAGTFTAGAFATDELGAEKPSIEQFGSEQPAIDEKSANETTGPIPPLTPSDIIEVRDDLADYLAVQLDAGATDVHLARIELSEPGAQEELFANLCMGMPENLPDCFSLEDGSLVLAIHAANAEQAHRSLEQVLPASVQLKDIVPLIG